MTLILLFLALTLNGGYSSSYTVNVLEISPNFAATVYGFMNIFAAAPGFIAPMVVGSLTNEQVLFLIVFYTN